jgi:hypothetical protein
LERAGLAHCHHGSVGVMNVWLLLQDMAEISSLFGGVSRNPATTKGTPKLQKHYLSVEVFLAGVN